MKIQVGKIAIFLTLLLTACNPMSEDAPFRLTSSLHSTKPLCSDIYHGAAYRFPQYGCSEANCHGADLTGGNSGARSCYSCHTGDLWSIFSVNHTLKVAGRYHHYDVDAGSRVTDDRNTDVLWYASCDDAACHGVALDGVTIPGIGFNTCFSCTNCHNPKPIPGHRRKMEHGAWHHFNVEKSPSTYCSGDVCHGPTGRGTGSGAIPATPCDDCHD